MLEHLIAEQHLLHARPNDSAQSPQVRNGSVWQGSSPNPIQNGKNSNAVIVKFALKVSFEYEFLSKNFCILKIMVRGIHVCFKRNLSRVTTLELPHGTLSKNNRGVTGLLHGTVVRVLKVHKKFNNLKMVIGAPTRVFLVSVSQHCHRVLTYSSFTVEWWVVTIREVALASGNRLKKTP